jgi:hypothetical protein
MIKINGIYYNNNLSRLNLSGKLIGADIDEIFVQLIQFKNLLKLNISSNNLSKLPKSINKLNKLRILNISSNDLIDVPDEICDLKCLESLYIFKNKLIILPDDIGKLSELKTLCLYNNELILIPNSINKLKKLKILGLNYNKLQNIPENINELIELEILGINHNKLSNLPTKIGELSKLNVLYINNNILYDLPLSIINCRRLQYIHYYDNPIDIHPRIQRFIDRINNYNNNHFFNDRQNIHASSIQNSVKKSIENIMKDDFNINKDDLINNLIKLSPKSLNLILEYFNDTEYHSTLYITFYELFIKVFGRIINSEYCIELLKRLDDELIESMCKCFTGRLSRLVNVLVGYYSDISINISDAEKISTIISNVLNGEEMDNELKSICKNKLKDADVNDEEINKWLDL